MLLVVAYFPPLKQKFTIPFSLVGGIPRPKCTWKRNDISLNTDPTCRIQEELVSTSSGHSNELICTMEIRHAKPSDAGTYSVNVHNESGSDSCSAVVTVLRNLPKNHFDEINAVN